MFSVLVLIGILFLIASHSVRQDIKFNAALLKGQVTSKDNLFYTPEDYPAGTVNLNNAVLAGLNTVESGFMSAPADKHTIDTHTVCREVENTGSEKIFFIPTRTAAEWQAFRDQPPADLNLAACGSYIEINNCEELQMIGHPELTCPVGKCDQSSYPLDGDYVLASNIDCSKTNPAIGGSIWDSKGFNPIGGHAGISPISPFTGLFDGKGYEVQNLFINRTSYNVGLFESIKNATIKNLGLASLSFTGDPNGGNGFVLGGLAGASTDSQIDNCYTSGNISQSADAGGLIGKNLRTPITNSHSACNVTAHNNSSPVGGLIGNNSQSDITNCYATGNLNSLGSAVGGLIGSTASGAINQCYAMGNIQVGRGEYIGGLVGINGSTITKSYATGNITCDKTGDGGGWAGGLVGYNTGGTISDSYATGDLDCYDRIGGLVGQVYNSTITNTYSVGKITGVVTSTIGGLIGKNQYNSTTTNSFWNTQTSGQTTSAGGTGASTINLVQEVTYTSWDFQPPTTDTWKLSTIIPIGSYYPCLAWQTDGTCPKPLSSTIEINSCEELQMIGHPELLSQCGAKCDQTSYPLNGNYKLIGTTSWSASIPTINCAATQSATSLWTDGKGWRPIGDSGTPFTGKLDGNGVQISSLYINRDSSDLGLFGTISGANVHDLNFSSFTFQGKSDNQDIVAAPLVARSLNHSNISNINLSADKLFDSRNITISEKNSASPAYKGHAAGLVGVNDNSTITNSVSNCNLSADGSAGGLVYQNVNGGVITSSSSKSDVTAGLYAGGLVALNTDATIEKSARLPYAGNDISGWVAGGLVGKSSGTSIIRESYFGSGSTMYVVGVSSPAHPNPVVGGLVGQASGIIANSYSFPSFQLVGTDVTNAKVGGLVGSSSNLTLTNTYNVGNLYPAKTAETAAVVGKLDNAPSATSNYWNTWNFQGTTPTLTLPGCTPDSTCNNGATGKSVSALLQRSTYSGWDFANTWKLADTDEGFMYPCLAWQDQSTCPLGLYRFAITDCKDLQNATYSRAYYYLDPDPAKNNGHDYIDCSATPFTTIGWFYGTLDGQGHEVHDLSITGSNVGIFGTVSAANGAEAGTIKNIDFVNLRVQLTGCNGSPGSLAQTLRQGALVSNVHVSGSIKGGRNIGGLVSTNSGSTIENSSAAVDLSAEGCNTQSMGGLVAFSYDNAIIRNSYATGKVDNSTSTYNSFYIGGLVGMQADYKNENNSIIENSYATGNVLGSSTLAGSVGGLIGYNSSAAVKNSYSVGAVTGGTYRGGFIGQVNDFYGPSAIEHSYFNTNTSGLSAAQACGYGSCTGVGQVSGQPTSSMTTQATYKPEWIFAPDSNYVWKMDTVSPVGKYYPCLSWQTDSTCPTTAVAASCTPACGSNASCNSGLCTCYSGFTDCDGDGNCECSTATQKCSGASCISQGISKTISSCVELQKIGNDPAYPLNGNYTLAQNIDCAATNPANPSNAGSMWDKTTANDATHFGFGGTGFKPIGQTTPYFSGTFNGQGYTISNLYINRPSENYVGLIGYASSMTIRNLGLIDTNIIGNNYVGAIVGRGHGDIYNSYNNSPNSNTVSTVNGKTYVGGLIGAHCGTISDSHNTGSVLAGMSYVVNGWLSVGKDVGGLVGHNDCSSSGIHKITNSYNTGNIHGRQYLGGLIGYGYNTTISRSYNTGWISGKPNQNNDSEVSYLGGIAGYLASTGSVSDSYANGGVASGYEAGAYDSSGSYIGGLVGQGGNIDNSYVQWGAINAMRGTAVGGLCGSCGTISKSYTLASGQSTYSGTTWSSSSGIICNSCTTSNTYYPSTVSLPYAPLNGAVSLPPEKMNSFAEPSNEGNFNGWTFSPTDKANWKLDTISESGTKTYYPCLAWQDDNTCRASTVSLPIEINNCEELQMIWHYTTAGALAACGVKCDLAAYPLGSNYILNPIPAQNNGHDYIDCSATNPNDPKHAGSMWGDMGFDPIGKENWDLQSRFYGNFDGNNKTISSLYINRNDEEPVGLFRTTGWVTGGPQPDLIEIKNLNLDNFEVHGRDTVGALIGGFTSSVTKLSNCSVTNSTITASATGLSNIGGLVGSGPGSIINSSVTNSTISGAGNDVGGLIGVHSLGAIHNSFTSNLTITGSDSVGGLVGVLSGYGRIEIYDSYSNNCAVSGHNYVGGLVGYNADNRAISNVEKRFITNTYAINNVSGNAAVGALFGLNNASDLYNISNSYWNTDLSALTGCGIGDCTGATGKTTAEMIQQSTYPAWTFLPTANANWKLDAITSGRDNETFFPCLTWQADDTCPKPTLSTVEINNCEELQNMPQAVGATYYLNPQPENNYDGGSSYIDCSPTNPADPDHAGSLWGTAPAARDLGAKGFMPLYLNGVFEGNNHEIRGLYINRPETGYLGLFGQNYSNSKIQNLKITDAYINGISNLGILIGWNKWQSEIENCQVSGKIICGNSFCGGLTGYNNGIISDASADTIIENGLSAIGGLVGINDNERGEIYRSFAKTNITAPAALTVGGLVGNNVGLVENSYALGSVSGYRRVGGLIGQSVSTNSIIKKSYASASVQGDNNVAGLIGRFTDGSLLNSYWNTSVGSSTGCGGTISCSSAGLSSSAMRTQTSYPSSGENPWLFAPTSNAPWKLNIITPAGSYFPCLSWQANNTCPVAPPIATPGVYANSNTGKSCTQICSELGLACNNIYQNYDPIARTVSNQGRYVKYSSTTCYPLTSGSCTTVMTVASNPLACEAGIWANGTYCLCM